MPSQSATPPIHIQLARASWIAPLLIIGANMILGQTPTASAVIVTLLAFGLAGIGLLAGVIALSGIGRHGTEGILIPSIIGILLSAVFLFLIGTNFSAAYQRARDPQAQLAAAAKKLQADLPRMIDKDTELVRVAAASGELIYDYRLVKYKEGELDAGKFNDVITPVLKKGLCPQFAAMPKAQFSYRILYASSDSAPLTEVVLNRSDCAP